jgi:hypothetical protein
LDFNKKESNQEILWLALKHDGLRNQLDKYKCRMAEILGKEVKGKRFEWWNLISKKARKKIGTIDFSREKNSA